MSSILVVDNEKSICEFLTIALEDDGYEVMTAHSGPAGTKLIKENVFDLVLTDIKMPRSNGIQVLEAVKENSPHTPVIMMTAYASAETAVEAMKKGAYDYISKPFEVEDLKLIIKNAIEKKKLHDENIHLKTALKEKYQFANIIGRSPAMADLFDLIQKVGENSATVLISGESGTGKELVAKAIHYNGSRRDHPFVSINCAAMPETLLESELFGYERGAFTGADSVKVGLMETAHKGSFFFDEICEATHSIQVKLLRVLQEREFNRVGGTKPIKVDLRIITATNRDVAQAVKDKTFREDLYYRLNVIPIHLPPLRERVEDIPLLVESFIKKYNERYDNLPLIRGIDAEALRILEKFPWPGNIRELENVIERAVVLEKGDMIQVSSLPDEMYGESSKPLDSIPSFDKERSADLEKTLDQVEKKMIVKALDLTGGVVSKAAKLLNLTFRSMRYRVQKHKIKGRFDVDEN